MMHPKVSIAYFITSHGFGHAARASAVMNAIGERWPFVHFEIFTQTPDWFFKDSLSVFYVYHFEKTDVGLVQTSPFCFDLNKTIEALSTFLPFDDIRLSRLSDAVRRAKCLLVISDISPLGLAVAKKAKIHSVLIENFTWDWIYEPYLTDDLRLKSYIDYLAGVFGQADYRIQAEPVCRPRNNHLCVSPVARSPRSNPSDIRLQLGLNDDKPLILITLGGISEVIPFVDNLRAYRKDAYFVVPGASPDLPMNGTKQENVILLPHHSAFYHPDLIAASDAVVGKVGYSTLAEVYHAGAPFGYIPRSDFRESGVFETYIEKNMMGIRISESDFYSGRWLERIPELLFFPRKTANESNGASVVADFICSLLACEKEIIEVVDSDGHVVGAAPRDCVHNNNQLLHRVVHVLVFDGANRLLLQKRSKSKKVAPSLWDTSVGGHVDCGEAIENAMLREMGEELGIHPEPPRYAYQYIHSNNVESELVFTYVCFYDGPIHFNPDEIDAVKFWTLAEIVAALGQGALSDNFEEEFQRYRTWAAGVVEEMEL